MKRVFLSALTLLSLCFSACAGALEVELYNALKKNDLKKCTELLKKGADINARAEVKKNHYAIQPLLYASRKGDLNMVRFLIKNKADANVLTFGRENALYYAIQGPGKTRLAVFKWLVQNTDINLTHTSKYNQTPRQLAEAKGCMEIVRFIDDYLKAHPKRAGQKTPKAQVTPKQSRPNPPAKTKQVAGAVLYEDFAAPDKNGNIRLLTNDGREKKFSKAEISSMDAKALIAAKCFVELIIFQKVHTTDAGAIYLCELAETGGLIAIFIGNNQAADFELSTAEEDCFEGFVQRMHDENGAPSVYDYNTEGGTNKTVRYYMLLTASQQN